MPNSASASFDFQEPEFLGHVISRKDILVDPAKVIAVLDLESSKMVTEI